MQRVAEGRGGWVDAAGASVYACACARARACPHARLTCRLRAKPKSAILSAAVCVLLDSSRFCGLRSRCRQEQHRADRLSQHKPRTTCSHTCTLVCTLTHRSKDWENGLATASCVNASLHHCYVKLLAGMLTWMTLLARSALSPSASCMRRKRAGPSRRRP